MCYEEALFFKIHFYIQILRPYFSAPGSQNGLKLKTPAEIDELSKI